MSDFNKRRQRKKSCLARQTSDTDILPPMITLGARHSDLPANAPKLTDAQMIRFALRFFEAKPRFVEELSSRVDHEGGRPRQLSLPVLLAGLLATAKEGSIHITKVSSTFRSLGIGQQIKLGLRWTNPDATRGNITHRQIDWLFDEIARAYDPKVVTHNHAVHDEDTGLVVNTSTGEVLGAFADFGSEQQIAFICKDSCPRATTVERLANQLLADLWDYLNIPKTHRYALDSYPVQTHFATKSYGAAANIDPMNMPEDVRHLADTVSTVQETTPPAKNKSKNWKTKSGSKTTTKAQKDAMAREYAKWDLQTKPISNAKSRALKAAGPTAEGDFTRIDSTFPRIGPDLRLQHSFDEGAGNTFRGAGRSRPSGIVNGRDKHALVATGKLPDGSAYPPFLIGYQASKGGNDKAAAALEVWDYVKENGVTIGECHLDRGYTAVPIERLLTPAHQRGIRLIRDLNANQRGSTPFSEGIQLIDGWWFPNGTPAALWDLPMHDMRASTEERIATQTRFDSRALYAFRVMNPMRNGKMRLRGPACPSSVKRNDSGVPISVSGVTVRCINSEYYHLLPRTLPRTICIKSQKCGCSRTPIIRENELPTSYEPLLYGTTNWTQEKGKRINVEIFNSLEQYHYGVNRHSIQVRARKWDLAHAMLTVALFIRALYNWMLRLGAWAIDDEYHHALDEEVIQLCLARVTTPIESNPTPT